MAECNIPRVDIQIPESLFYFPGTYHFSTVTIKGAIAVPLDLPCSA